MPDLNGEKKGKLKILLKSNDVKFLVYLEEFWDYIRGRTASDFGVSIDEQKIVYMHGGSSRGDSDTASDEKLIHVQKLKELIEEAIKDE